MKIFFIALALFSTVLTAHAGESFFCIQVLMTSNLVNADNTFNKLKSYGNTRVEKINQCYAVRIGAYRDRSQADSLLNRLKKTYPDAFIKICTKNNSSIVRGKFFDDGEKVRFQATKTSNKPLQYRADPPKPPTVHKQEKTSEPAANPEDDFKIGMQNYKDRKYDGAISSLSRYISLSPNNKQHAESLLAIGKSFAESNRIRPALRIFSRVIEQYPESPEAMLSVMAMADLGVSKPGFKYPISMKGAEYFRDPIFAYDLVSAKNVPEQVLEYTRYQKGVFFWKTGRYKESCAVHTDLLREYPKTPYRKDINGMMKTSLSMLIRQHYESGDHVSVANLFFQAKEKELIAPDDRDAYLKSALSFAYLGLYDVSANILDTLRTHEKTKKSADIDKVASEVDRIKVSAISSQSPDNSKWNLFQTGMEYLKSNNLPQAEQTLTGLKNTGGDAFWAKLTAYALEDNAWSQKYPGYVGKK